MSKHEMTWNQFSKIYGVGMTEHIAHDTTIEVGRYGLKMVSSLNNRERNTYYSFNVYSLEADKDILICEHYIETMDEIFEIIASEFNIID